MLARLPEVNGLFVSVKWLEIRSVVNISSTYVQVLYHDIKYISKTYTSLYFWTFHPQNTLGWSWWFNACILNYCALSIQLKGPVKLLNNCKNSMTNIMSLIIVELWFSQQWLNLQNHRFASRTFGVHRRITFGESWYSSMRINWDAPDDDWGN